MRKQKTWYCPHYSQLPQFKRRGGTRTSAQPSMASIQAAMKLDNICICKAKPSTTETVVECHGDNCKNWKIFPPYLPQFKQNAQQLLEMF